MSPANQLVAADVGTDIYEEVNVVEPGADYGFPDPEGPTDEPGIVAPSLWFTHESNCNSIIGGEFVPASFANDDAGAWYTFSDLGCGGVWAVSFDGSTVTDLVRLSEQMDVVAANLIWGPDNTLYVVAIGPEAQPIQRLAKWSPTAISPHRSPERRAVRASSTHDTSLGRPRLAGERAVGESPQHRVPGLGDADLQRAARRDRVDIRSNARDEPEVMRLPDACPTVAAYMIFGWILVTARATLATLGSVCDWPEAINLRVTPTSSGRVNQW